MTTVLEHSTKLIIKIRCYDYDIKCFPPFNVNTVPISAINGDIEVIIPVFFMLDTT